MDHARIIALLRPFVGEAAQQLDLSGISMYIDILLRWNTRVNLTAIRDPEHIVSRHFGESLFTARHLFPHSSSCMLEKQKPTLDEAAAPRLEAHDRTPAQLQDTGYDPPAEVEQTDAAPQVQQTHEAAAAERRQSAAHGASRGCDPTDNSAAEQRKKITLADVGSGAGFPGVPIKLWAPEIHLTLIESNQKKATFLKEVSRALTLTDVDIKNTRAETLKTKFDLVTMRAVERFEHILPTAAALVSPNGRLALLIGSAQVARAQALLSTFHASAPLAIPQSASRTLLILRHPDC
jgi:16S rRNA (guanine(527)-N(7))-methyltransferase RsmG